MSNPTPATRPASVVALAGTDAPSPAHAAIAVRGDGAQYVTVVVITSGFYYQGRRYRERDELDVPADQLHAWLDGGHVRLPAEQQHDARDIADAFDRGQPISRR